MARSIEGGGEEVCLSHRGVRGATAWSGERGSRPQLRRRSGVQWRSRCRMRNRCSLFFFCCITVARFSWAAGPSRGARTERTPTFYHYRYPFFIHDQPSDQKALGTQSSPLISPLPLDPNIGRDWVREDFLVREIMKQAWAIDFFLKWVGFVFITLGALALAG